MEDQSSKTAARVGKPLARHWTALLDHVAATHPASDRSDDWLCLTWPGKLKQTVQIKLLEVGGRMRIVVTADICHGDQVSHTDALELGAKLLVGAVILHKGVLSVRHVFSDDAERAGKPLDVAPRSRAARLLDETIVSLRDDAVRIRRILFARRARRAAAHFQVD